MSEIFNSRLYKQFASAYYALAEAQSEKYAFRQGKKRRHSSGTPTGRPAATTPVVAPRHPYDVRAQRQLQEVAARPKTAPQSSGRRYVDLRNPEAPAPHIEKVAQHLPTEARKRALAKLARDKGAKWNTVGHLHKYIEHLSEDLAHDHVRPKPHRLDDGTVIHRFDHSDLSRYGAVKERIQSDLWKRLGYSGMVTKGPDGRPVYKSFTEKARPAPPAAVAETAPNDLEQFCRAYYGQQPERYAFRDEEGNVVQPEPVQAPQPKPTTGRASSILGKMRAKQAPKPPSPPQQQNAQGAFSFGEEKEPPPPQAGATKSTDEIVRDASFFDDDEGHTPRQMALPEDKPPQIPDPVKPPNPAAPKLEDENHGVPPEFIPSAKAILHNPVMGHELEFQKLARAMHAKLPPDKQTEGGNDQILKRKWTPYIFKSVRNALARIGLMANSPSKFYETAVDIALNVADHLWKASIWDTYLKNPKSPFMSYFNVAMKHAITAQLDEHVKQNRELQESQIQRGGRSRGMENPGSNIFDENTRRIEEAEQEGLGKEKPLDPANLSFFNLANATPGMVDDIMNGKYDEYLKDPEKAEAIKLVKSRNAQKKPRVQKPRVAASEQPGADAMSQDVATLKEAAANLGDDAARVAYMIEKKLQGVGFQAMAGDSGLPGAGLMNGVPAGRSRPALITYWKTKVAPFLDQQLAEGKISQETVRELRKVATKPYVQGDTYVVSPEKISGVAGRLKDALGENSDLATFVTDKRAMGWSWQSIAASPDLPAGKTKRGATMGTDAKTIRKWFQWAAIPSLKASVLNGEIATEDADKLMGVKVRYT